MAEKKFQLNVFAFTDSHGHLKHHKEIQKKSKDANLLICAGDFTIFERDMTKILKEFDSWGKRILLIHGNHENKNAVKKECEKLKNVIFLHNKIYSLGNIHFFGFGGGGFSEKDAEFETKLARIENAVSGKHFIFFTHQPPHDTKLDRISGGSAGSKTYRRFMNKHNPHIYICGHLHDNFKKHEMIKNTLVINPGPGGAMLKI